MHFGVEMWKYAKLLKIPAENAEMSHRHRPNASAFLMGTEMRINSLGLRDRDDLTLRYVRNDDVDQATNGGIDFFVALASVPSDCIHQLSPIHIFLLLLGSENSITRAATSGGYP